ncbi:biopolymer transporter Tol, partial [Burkholderia multivorans]
MAGEAEYTEDEKWLVVRGRRWRRTDPELPDRIVEDLKSHLGRARNAVKAARKADDSAALQRARGRVDLAKRG